MSLFTDMARPLIVYGLVLWFVAAVIVGYVGSRLCKSAPEMEDDQ